MCPDTAETGRPFLRCPNCNHDLTHTALYCPVCGQKTGPSRVTFKEILSDFFDSVFNLNSQFLASLTRLFIPGLLTTEYFRGRRARYMNPLRLFFVTMIIMYAVLGITYLGDVESGIGEYTPYEAYQARQEAEEVVRESANRHLDEDSSPETCTFVDSLMADISAYEYESEFAIRSTFKRDSTIQLTADDVYGLDTDSLMRKYELTSFWEKLMTQQLIRAQRDPAGAISSALANTSWMILLLMPALALVMKLLYIRRDKYFVQHLVFLFHYHAAVFVTMIVYLPLFEYLPEWLRVTIPVVCMVGLPLAMKRFYRQGWGKTMMKFFILLFAYMGILLVFMIATFVISLLLFS